MAIAALGPIAWLLPERTWRPLGHALSVAIARLWPAVTRARVSELAEALEGSSIERSPDDLRLAILDGYMEERLQILCAHRPGGWHPRLRLLGRAHLETALMRGHGAILWAAPLSYADLVIKMALAQAGFAVSHLSTFARGFSPNACVQHSQSRFAMRVLSPLRTRIEDRHLRERIALSPEGSLAYARQLERRLRANGIVSIRAGDGGHRTVATPFLTGSLRLATGAPSLAVTSGASLLPVLVSRVAAGVYDVIIEPSLTDAREAIGTRAHPGGRHELIDELSRRYARILEQHVLRHPELWSGWYALKAAAEHAPASPARRAPAIAQGGA
jgi:lauroyl/myristoyl acyltransferase